MDERWRLLYQSDLQSVYALLVVPALFLVWLAIRGRRRVGEGRDARFVLAYAVVFGIETLLDPISTGPAVEWLDLGFDATSALMVCFVLIGDFRVFLLVFHGTDPRRRLARSLGVAALWTLVVPLFAFSLNAGLERLRPELTGQRLWLIYELSFLALALVLRARVLPRRGAEPAALRFARLALGYVAAYYALWALSDALILLLGRDEGWLLRAVPNQLYYSFWIPFVFFAYPATGQVTAPDRGPGRA